jgi:hypothetical protein
VNPFHERPYMTGIVAVADQNGNVPPVTKEQLPFIGHLGVDSLPASAVVAVLPTVAPTDADKLEKWDIAGVADEVEPAVPGVGEVWVDTQFEAVPNQVGDRGVPKAGTITVVDAAGFEPEREVTGLDAEARRRWNNPDNMWADARLRTIYNGHWFGRWHKRSRARPATSSPPSTSGTRRRTPSRTRTSARRSSKS